MTDTKTQRIVTQLKNIYNSYIPETDNSLQRTYSHLLFNYVYDQVLADGHEIKYSPAIKSILWELSKTECNYQRKAWITTLKTQTDPELIKFFKKQLKDELEKFYKTYLVRKFLFDKVRNENMILDIKDEEGNKVLPLSWTIK